MHSAAHHVMRNGERIHRYYNMPQVYDTALFSYGLSNLAYIARCLGIFGDEKRYQDEADRLSSLVFNRLGTDQSHESKDLFIHDVHAGVHFRVTSMTPEVQAGLMDNISRRYGPLPFYDPSAGIDTASTLAGILNLVHLKNADMYSALDKIMHQFGKTCALPEYYNPVTGHGCNGEGDSRVCASLLCTVLKNLLFIDRTERLELFPVPREKWFRPGDSFVIRDAPSRFGLLSYRVVSGPSDVRIMFDALPRFIPPDIMINLPFRTTLRNGDDFIIKKSEGTSHVINGWPVSLCFIRQ